MKKIEEYLHLYFGCDMSIRPESSQGRVGTFIGFVDENKLSARLKFRAGPEGQASLLFCKPILRPLSDMTNEEADYFAWLCMDSEHHLEEETRVTQEEIDTDLHMHDGGNMLDGDVEIYIAVTVRCFQGAIVFKRDGSISVYDEDEDKYESVENIAFKIQWLLSKHFDLFGLIESGLALDASTINQ